jgi:uracil-DNA glycosylase
MTEAAERAPGKNCPLCPRLVAFRTEQRRLHPDWHNAPVPSFGSLEAQLLIVGLAPGLQGANRTGRPFTGDYAGELLYATLLKFGFASGTYAARADDGLSLVGCRITNAVRCAPPQNKPTGMEIAACRAFLSAEMGAMARLKAVLALGRVAHDSVIAAQSLKRASFPFAHGAGHDLGDDLRLFDSYHCSRYNTNTGRLTREMFEQVFATIADYVAG